MIKISKIFYWIMIQSRWLQIWSKLYRFLHNEGKYKKAIPVYTDPVLLQMNLDLIEYRRDGFKELFDVAHSPFYLNHVLEEIKDKNDQPNGSFDCTSYAILAIHMLDWHFNAHLLGVSYKRKNKRLKFGGHMVCYFETPFGFRHMGNWGLSSNYRTLEAMAKDIAYRADSELIGYTILDKNLKIVKVHT